MIVYTVLCWWVTFNWKKHLARSSNWQRDLLYDICRAKRMKVSASLCNTLLMNNFPFYYLITYKPQCTVPRIQNEFLKKLKKKVAKQQELRYFKAEHTHLSSSDGHGKSMSTQPLCCCHTNDASLQITKQMSKWVGYAQHLAAHPLHTVSQIPPYVTWLFVHTIQILTTNRK